MPPCKHGFWHKLRSRLATKLMPKCVRAEIGNALFDQVLSRNLAAYLTGNTAQKDQAQAALRDLGATIIKKEN